ncbi:sensor histidine kinase [Phytohabitans rumicis]|uniref:histidine kinase n=1 Tax=Phytohabitans rumicis TaxID=1076125 RepID=A0A6V8KU91_9ACTN|nr:histidine kinase [Phytohabitans rumicis]GFJ87020.1 two-component sensor histidine kinase [Phytohabitans rumicis]
MIEAHAPQRRRGLPALAWRVCVRHPLLVDAAIAGLLLVPGGDTLGHQIAERPVLLPLLAGLVVPLVWRRRAPLTVFAAIAAAASVQWLLAIYPMPANVALLVALYTVAVHRTRRQTLLAGAVLGLGILLVCLRWAPLDKVLHSFVALGAMAVAVAVAGVNIQTRRAYLASLEDRAQRLERERDQQAQLAIAGERSRIARELHDIVTHNISVMVALADAAVFAQQRAPVKATAALRQIAGTGRQALTDMRRFLGLLRHDEPDALRHPMPGIAQLEALADHVRAAGVPVRLDIAGDMAALPAAAELTVYRLIQEALTNTLKHTPAGTSATVRVHRTASAIAVSVTDDGPPVRAAVAAAGGHGIHGMRERTAAYGGQLEAGPNPHGGWRVTALLDLTGARV